MVALQFLPLPFGLQVRTSTLIASAAVFGVVTWHNRSPWRGFAALAAFISAYELLYVGTGWLLGHWPLLYVISTTGMLGWVLLDWHLGHRPALIWVVVFGVAWLGWGLLGFHVNEHGLHGSFNLGAELANVVTKSLLAVAYSVGSYR